MFDFYAACGILFVLLGVVAHKRLTTDNPDQDQDGPRVSDLARKVAELEKQLETNA